MMNRISNRLIARFVAIAALLALVMAAPAVFAQDSELEYEENDTEPVGNFSATDADDDPIVFSLSGPDVKLFEISEGGALSFKKSPNFESPGDSDKDNVYMVTVSAARGSTDVAVTVTNVDEPGSVELLDLQPQAGAGQSVTAEVSDPDGDPISTAWQWSRSMDMTEWTDIAGATAATYTPQEEDENYYLRASATYSDGLGTGRDAASGESAFPVEIRPTANFAPSFEIQDDTGPEVDDVTDVTGEADTIGDQDIIVITRTVDETAKVGASVGNAVTATDADNDPLIYRLTGENFTLEPTVDSEDTTSGDSGDAVVVKSQDLFKIDRKSGQISVKDDDYLDFDKYATTLDDPDTDDDERALVYTVNVTATDPSGAITDPSPQKVTIKVAPVDEAPKITRVTGDAGTPATIIAAGADSFLVNTDEQSPLDPADVGGADSTSSDLPVFSAADPEDIDSTEIEWSVAGPDAGRFQIVKLATEVVSPGTDPTATNTAALRWKAKDRKAPSFEAMDSADGTNVYEVVVRASDGKVRGAVTVTVTVDNIEEPGKVSLTQRVPQEGIPITASLTDADLNISATKWQWYRGDGTLNINNDGDLVFGATVTPATATDPISITDGTEVTNCDLTAAERAADTTVSSTCAINNGTSATYVPARADRDKKLQVRVTYVDGFVSDEFTVGTDGAISRAADREKDGEDGDVAAVTSEHPSRVRPNANTRPRFLNKGPEEREVAENEKGASVGDPVAGIDTDPLKHALSGDDAASFNIDDSGQITTKVKLDYETKSSYTVTVTATDPSLSSQSIVVNITVIDVDDAAIVTLLADNGDVEYAENGTEPVGNFSATDADGDPIVFSLSGPDVKLFEISEAGALSFKKSPNFESPGDSDKDNVYMVTVSAARGSTDVAVTVTNVDEPGSVELLDLQPQAGAGQSVTAEVSDPDGDPISTAWQWSRSMDMTEWTDIAGATAATYTPQEEDENYYLRASATYSDGLGTGRDAASGESAFPVEIRPTANFAPSFEIQDDTGPEVDDVTDVTGEADTIGDQDIIVITRTVDETAKVGASVGNAVTATDADNDPLIYRLTGENFTLEPTVDSEDTTSGDSGDAVVVKSQDLFKIDRKSGQISVKDDDYLDFDKYATTLDDPDTDDDERALVYTVNVTATDPSGAITDPSPQKVTIKVAPVDEAPKITRVTGDAGTPATIIAAGADSFLVNTDEQSPLDPADVGGAGSTSSDLPVFSAADPEDIDSTEIEWSVAGPDAGRFQIVKLATEVVSPGTDPTATNTAALRWKAKDRKAPSFEAMDSADGTNVYEVVVRASDGKVRGAVTVTVTVDNIEEPGKVKLTQRVPQEGIPITASLTDVDLNISATKWQWYRGAGALHIRDSDGVLVFDSTDDAVAIDSTTGVVSGGTPVTNCVLTDDEKAGPDGELGTDDDVTTASDTCAINDGTSATYLPTRADKDEKLQVRVTYVDGFVSDEFTVGTDGAIDRTEGRTADGEDGDVASATSEHPSRARPNSNTRPRFLNKGPEEREVAENEKGASVGDPVAGIDTDPLKHTLSGDDAASFDIDDSGQITTKVKLDYETKDEYTVTVTATDPSLASESIVVNITVTDADDAGTVILLTGNPPAFAADEMTRSVAENTAAGMAIGDPVAATDEDGDALTYTLWGDDADSFTIDSTGQLMTSAALDYETKMSYTVTVSASSGKADEVDAMTTVTIMVTDEGLDNAYDLNEDGTIERDEVIAAIQDYLAGNIERSEVTALIRLYFGNGG